MTSLKPEAAVGLNVDQLVTQFYHDVWRFALSLSGNSTDTADLTQQTFYRLQIKGDQIRDPRKAKGWLLSTLYHEHLKGRRRQARFPLLELSEVENELPPLTPGEVENMEVETVFAAVQRLDNNLRIPLCLFYLEEMSYQEIAALLEVPIGTVMSRLFRAKRLLRRLLGAERENQPEVGVEFTDPVPSGAVQ